MASANRSGPSPRVGPHALAAALLAVALGTPRIAAAFDIRHTKSGAPVRWQTEQVALEIDPSVAAAVPGALAAVLTSVSAWAAAPDAPVVSVTMASAASSPAVDGHNVVYFMADGYAEAGEALAVTLVSFDDATGEIIDADIVINGRYAFAVLAADCTPTSEDVAIPNDPVEQTTAPYAYGSAEPFDLVHVVAHETGHLLGLLDAVAEPNDLMFLYTSPHDAARRAPAPDDVAGLDALYSTSSQGCTMAPGPHGASDMGLFLLAPLAGFAVRRRRVRSP